MRKRYTNVAIPEELASQIDKVMDSSKLGYSSRAQFVMEAIRNKIKEEKQ